MVHIYSVLFIYLLHSILRLILIKNLKTDFEKKLLINLSIIIVLVPVHCCYFSVVIILIYFWLTKDRVAFFRPKKFLHLMPLIFKLFIKCKLEKKNVHSKITK